MHSDLFFRSRAIRKRLVLLSGGDERFVDMGVRLYVVVQDLAKGVEVIPGKPAVRCVATHDIGGLYDRGVGQFVGPSERPLKWTCSPEQAELILHPETLKPKLLVYGAEGAGKTETLAMYVLVRALQYAADGHSGFAGCTAPTNDRLSTIERKLVQRMPMTWYTQRLSDQEIILACGITIQLRSAAKRSADLGSPIQGYDWLFAASDEQQDQMDADPDVETRGRAAPGGVYRRFSTATAKDSAAWRAYRDEKRASDAWSFKRLEGLSNPFVHPRHWETLKRTLSKRDYQRRVLALDVGPEHAVYPEFSRERHLRPIPQLGAKDVTAAVLGAKGPDFRMLIGHDPGETNASVMLRAYQLPGSDLPTWWVVDELVTKGTTERHIDQLTERLRTRWGVQTHDGGRALVRYDPTTGQSEKTRSVTVKFRTMGFRAMAAHYGPKGTPMTFPREDRIELVCTLLENAEGTTRLYFDVDARGNPCCPELIESLEDQERDGLGRSEQKLKHVKDLTHTSVAVGYAVWALEKPRMGGMKPGQGGVHGSRNLQD